MRDYSKYEKTPVLFSGAEKKFEIIIDGFRYIVKFQKNSEVGLIFNYVSEYLGSHIFQLIGIPVQETFLGTYEGKNVVVMKNFLEPEDDLVAFNGVGESSLERDKELYQYTYEDSVSGRDASFNADIHLAFIGIDQISSLCNANDLTNAA